jgi:hypothetical protein
MRAVKDSPVTRLFRNHLRTRGRETRKNRIKEGMEPDDLLCSRNARHQKALARAIGTSRRASRWAGEKVARSRKSNSPHPRRITSALEGII